jgi:hypothetical protein
MIGVTLTKITGGGRATGTLRTPLLSVERGNGIPVGSLAWSWRIPAAIPFAHPTRQQNETRTMSNDSDDKRGGARKKTLKGATISYQNGQCTMTCTIRDLSESGARLKPADPVHVPESFTLILADGTAYQCKRVRKAADEVAVRFL